MAVSTSSICVGSRCVWVETGVGAVASQNLTDPRAGEAWGWTCCVGGIRRKRWWDELVKAGAYPEYRQIGVVDRVGGTAAHTGSRVYLENKRIPRGQRGGLSGTCCFRSRWLWRSGRGSRQTRTCILRSGW